MFTTIVTSGLGFPLQNSISFIYYTTFCVLIPTYKFTRLMKILKIKFNLLQPWGQSTVSPKYLICKSQIFVLLHPHMSLESRWPENLICIYFSSISRVNVSIKKTTLLKFCCPFLCWQKLKTITYKGRWIHSILNLTPIFLSFKKRLTFYFWIKEKICLACKFLKWVLTVLITYSKKFTYSRKTQDLNM